jgi:hypothetical protein
MFGSLANHPAPDAVGATIHDEKEPRGSAKKPRVAKRTHVHLTPA